MTRERFARMLVDAAGDSGRRVAVVRHVGQAPDHPELLTVPETGYLKGTLLRALD
jgi:23S rRNA (cytosine1962-C5)-methyltransferase